MIITHVISFISRAHDYLIVFSSKRYFFIRNSISKSVCRCVRAGIEPLLYQIPNQIPFLVIFFMNSFTFSSYCAICKCHDFKARLCDILFEQKVLIYMVMQGVYSLEVWDTKPREDLMKIGAKCLCQLHNLILKPKALPPSPGFCLPVLTKCFYLLRYEVLRKKIELTDFKMLGVKSSCCCCLG